jgi:hypothetical protein
MNGSAGQLNGERPFCLGRLACRAAVQNVSGMVGLAERHSLDGIDSSPAISGNPLNLECRRGYPASTFCVFPQQYWAVLGRFGDNECHRNYFAELS